MRRFLRKSTEREPLAVTMTGVRMGERALQIGLTDVRLAVQLAAKPGLSGHSALVVADDATASRARAAAAESGLLLDVQASGLDALPAADRAFDVVIVHGAAEMLAPLDPELRRRIAGEWHRVLRPGGRLVALEAGTPTGLGALLRRQAPNPPASAGAGTADLLQAAGFNAVRLLADREGYRFLEGLKT